MRIYGIYDITNKEQCVRVGTLQEIMKFLSVSARSIDSAVKRGTRLCNRYNLVYLYKEEWPIDKEIPTPPSIMVGFRKGKEIEDLEQLINMYGELPKWKE